MVCPIPQGDHNEIWDIFQPNVADLATTTYSCLSIRRRTHWHLFNVTLGKPAPRSRTDSDASQARCSSWCPTDSAKHWRQLKNCYKLHESITRHLQCQGRLHLHYWAKAAPTSYQNNGHSPILQRQSSHRRRHWLPGNRLLRVAHRRVDLVLRWTLHRHGRHALCWDAHGRRHNCNHNIQQARISTFNARHRPPFNFSFSTTSILMTICQKKLELPLMLHNRTLLWISGSASYGPDVHHVTQPTVAKHWMKLKALNPTTDHHPLASSFFYPSLDSRWKGWCSLNLSCHRLRSTSMQTWVGRFHADFFLHLLPIKTFGDQWNTDWLSRGFTSHSTQNRSFRRCSPSQSPGLVWNN